MIFIKSLDDFLLNEATKNRNESYYILRCILADIKKKYKVEGSISFNSLELQFEYSDYNIFVNDKSFIKSLKQKYNTIDKTIIYNEYVSGHCRYEIHIKDLFFDRVVVPKYLYHVTTKDKVDSIKRHGLIPSSNPTFYGTCSYDKPFVFASIDKNRLFINDDNAVVLIINTEGLNNKWYKDFNFPKDKNHICTQQSIPKSAIKIISYKMFDKNRNKY